jgi:hypothetical protein
MLGKIAQKVELRIPRAEMEPYLNTMCKGTVATLKFKIKTWSISRWRHYIMFKLAAWQSHEETEQAMNLTFMFLRAQISGKEAYQCHEFCHSR